MKQNVKKMYTAPLVEIMEARVEAGFAGSTTTPPTVGNATESFGQGETNNLRFN